VGERVEEKREKREVWERTREVKTVEKSELLISPLGLLVKLMTKLTTLGFFSVLVTAASLPIFVVLLFIPPPDRA